MLARLKASFGDSTNVQFRAQCQRWLLAVAITTAVGACSNDAPAGHELSLPATPAGTHAHAPVGAVAGAAGGVGSSGGSAASQPTVAGSDGGSPKPAADGGNTASAGTAGAGGTTVSAATSCPTFSSTFEAIQNAVFERHGCTAQACHGEAKVGGLDLRHDAAYDSLVGGKSQTSPFNRVEPGLPSRSYLYLKLEAATTPARSSISNSPMPVGAPPLSTKELEAVQWWIREGAPRTGVVTDNVPGSPSGYVAGLLDVCLPPAAAIPIAPLEPPVLDEGVQLTIPPLDLTAQSESEVCFAYYYDFTKQVPARFRDDTRGVFYVKSMQVRQDPQSHHLSILNSTLSTTSIHDPAFGAWTCAGGPKVGATCEATDPQACGEGGSCTSAPQASTSCVGYGPFGVPVDILGDSRIASAPTAQFFEAARDGVYREVPLKALVYVNTHAFNLATNPTTLHAWANFYFADDLRFLKSFRTTVNDVGIAAGTPPFATKEYCATWEAPVGTTLMELTSHTHKRGKYFWINDPSGKRIYESFDYADPALLSFDPPLVLDASASKDRTFKYCARFANGVDAQGAPDTRQVTRLSTMPDGTTCTPVACAAGKIGTPCNGSKDNLTCDSAPGANDGWCDACPITAGLTSENEMFLISTTTIAPAPKN